jgi:hypothetical protein
MDYEDWNPPAGDGEGGTNVESFGGISGIVHAANGMFLVGVFLGDGRPATPEPSRLDFTNGMPADPLAPELGQTFLIGDGKGHKYQVPPEATRLYLGFADGYLYQGPPGTGTRVPLAGTTTTPVSSRSRSTSRWAEVSQAVADHAETHAARSAPLFVITP